MCLLTFFAFAVSFSEERPSPTFVTTKKNAYESTD